MSSDLVVAEQLVKTFQVPRGGMIGGWMSVGAVNGVSFAIPAGSTFGLVGESGSGKTTLARMLLKLETPTSGRLLFDGREVFGQNRREQHAYRRQVQAVLQDPYDALSPRMRIGRIVAEPMRAHGVSARGAEARAAELLQRVGLEQAAAQRFPHELSGGQRQRVAVARALSVDPRLLVLDEPVSALDVSVRAQILNLLRDLQAALGTTFLFIGHDLAVVRFLSDVVGVLYFGHLVELGPARAVLRTPLHPYTQRLVAVASDQALLGASRLVGELPDPANPPRGCAFHSRCAFAVERCMHEPPLRRELAPGHSVMCHRAEEIGPG